MMEMLIFVLNKITTFVAFLLNLEILEYSGRSVTMLGFMGALVIVGIMIKLWMPKP